MDGLDMCRAEQIIFGAFAFAHVEMWTVHAGVRSTEDWWMGGCTSPSRSSVRFVFHVSSSWLDSGKSAGRRRPRGLSVVFVRLVC